MNCIAGSDAHVSSTIGRCINTVESENNIDSILNYMLKGKIKIKKEEYATKQELYSHAYYILSKSKDLILEYISEIYPKYYWISNLAFRAYLDHPDNIFWKFLASFALYLAKRASMKVNVKGYDPKVFEKRSWKTLISMSLIP